MSDTPQGQGQRRLDPTTARAWARVLRPRPWLRHHIPLLWPSAYRDPRLWYLDQLERMLRAGIAPADPVEPLADALGRLARRDEV